MDQTTQQSQKLLLFFSNLSFSFSPRPALSHSPPRSLVFFKTHGRSSAIAFRAVYLSNTCVRFLAYHKTNQSHKSNFLEQRYGQPFVDSPAFMLWWRTERPQPQRGSDHNQRLHFPRLHHSLCPEVLSLPRVAFYACPYPEVYTPSKDGPRWRHPITPWVGRGAVEWHNVFRKPYHESDAVGGERALATPYASLSAVWCRERS